MTMIYAFSFNREAPVSVLPFMEIIKFQMSYKDYFQWACGAAIRRPSASSDKWKLLKDPGVPHESDKYGSTIQEHENHLLDALVRGDFKSSIFLVHAGYTYRTEPESPVYPPLTFKVFDSEIASVATSEFGFGMPVKFFRGIGMNYHNTLPFVPHATDEMLCRVFFGLCEERNISIEPESVQAMNNLLLELDAKNHQGGSFNFIFSDGEYVYAYSGNNPKRPLQFLELENLHGPPGPAVAGSFYSKLFLIMEALNMPCCVNSHPPATSGEIIGSDKGSFPEKMIVIAEIWLPNTEWREITPGQLAVFKDGECIYGGTRGKSHNSTPRQPQNIEDTTQALENSLRKMLSNLEINQNMVDYRFFYVSK